MDIHTNAEPAADEPTTDATDETRDIGHISLVVPMDDIERLRPFISTEETRYCLNGVRFERGPKGVVLVATDGHRLGVYNSTEGYVVGDGIVRLPRRMLKAGKGKRRWLVVGKFGGADMCLVYSTTVHKATALDIAETVSLANAEAIHNRPLIDGTYPDWRRVVPDKLGKRSASFNSQYLAAYSAVNGEKYGAGITLYGDGENDPHIVNVSGEANFIGVQMPMRADGIAALPLWLPEPA